MGLLALSCTMGTDRTIRPRMTDTPGLPSLNAEAIGVHELFMSYVTAGFTREEAMTLVVTLMTLGHIHKGKQ